MSTFNIGNVSGTGNVFGDHNSVVAAGPLAELERALAGHCARLADPQAVAEATRSLRAELETSRPRRHRVTELLGVIAAGAGGATAVAQAIESVRAVLA